MYDRLKNPEHSMTLQLGFNIRNCHPTNLKSNPFDWLSVLAAKYMYFIYH